jgi:sugar phosphate isomerase/epimerase
MHLSFSSNAFKRTSLHDAAESIARAGYRGLEIMADVPHAYPRRFDAPARRDLHKHLADLGLTVSNVNGFTGFGCDYSPGADGVGDTYHPTWLEDDAAARAERIAHTKAAIELAAEFNCRTLSLQPGGPLIGTTLSHTEAGKRFADGLAQCLGTAKAHNVTLAIEPEPGLYIQTSAEYLDFKRQFFPHEPLIRMNCDIGHLFCVGEAPHDVIRTCHHEIAHIHLEDIGANRVHQHLTPGRGAVDFQALFQTIRDVNYQGRLTVELYPYEISAAHVAQAAMQYLSPIMAGTRLQ